MLKTQILHPEILRVLGSSGHGSRVMIADGNFPFITESPQTATKVFLNLRPGMVNVTDVLATLIETIPIEAAFLMDTPDSTPVPLHDTIRKMLPEAATVNMRKRHDFYAEVKNPATSLVIATGEERRFANVLLTIGVVRYPVPGQV
jgi:L-fucose mutarotase